MTDSELLAFMAKGSSIFTTADGVLVLEDTAGRIKVPPQQLRAVRSALEPTYKGVDGCWSVIGRGQRG